jgi:hypothetical protein
MEGKRRMSRCDSVRGCQNPIKHIWPILALLVIILLVGIGAETCLAQASVEEFRSALSANAGFTGDDFASLERGEPVIKVLSALDKREVAVCGVQRLRGTPSTIMKAFNQSLAQQNNGSILAIGRFSYPPRLADVETLSLERNDIEDLKRCVVGECELKLSAATIGRFQNEVDWTAPDYQHQATRLFQEMLLDYVRDYQSRGDAALIEYHDQRRPVAVREEHRALLSRSHYINDFAPEFASYLKNFPKSDLSIVESYINWTKLKFGLKPVIIVTHVASYSRPDNNAQQMLTVSKQVYANHYFDSSLAATAVISIPTTYGGPECYLFYTNYSRVDSLMGSFSKVKRGLVESESEETLRHLLHQTRANVEVASANASVTTPASLMQRISDLLFRGARQHVWLLVLVLLGVLIVLSRLNAERMKVRAQRKVRSSTKYEA